MTIFELIKKAADKRGMSLRQVAKKAGMRSETAIYRYNQGVTPRDSTLLAIASALDVPVSYFNQDNIDSEIPDTPSWATEQDTQDLKKFLEKNRGSMTYEGEELTDDELAKLELAMTQVFWDRHKHN